MHVFKKMFSFKLTFFNSLMVFCQLVIAISTKNAPGNEMKVFLTVSSLASTSLDNVTTQRQLELNWYNGAVLVDDVVRLYDHDPIVDSTNPLVEIVASEYLDNYYLSPVMFGRLDMNEIPVATQCLGFWIGYIRQGDLIASNCFKTQPNWMWENRNAYASLKFRDMMIPGTHDAGSYEYYVGWESDNIAHRWVSAQEENFWEQMMYGIRDFDLRVSYYEDTPEIFWLNHAAFRVNPFVDFIEDVKKFLNRTNEVLFLDFHGFPVGFDNYPERHLQLITYVTQELGDYMLPPSVGSDVVMDTLWKSNKRIIVAYSDNNYKASDLLWPGIPQIWANTMDVAYLESYINGFMSSRRTDIWSAQLELTETASDVVLTTSSLRILADEVNRNVTRWCRDLWWNEANIVALDYFLGTNVIEVAIESNIKRASNQNNKNL